MQAARYKYYREGVYYIQHSACQRLIVGSKMYSRCMRSNKTLLTASQCEISRL